ncbi:MAG: WYL domain-containing protein, partial [Chloroflexi bacterium]|nr:WYL domain-containing protein [Chloroflexota bacterium]
MKQMDRRLLILMRLREETPVRASDLAQDCECSVRTVYRDIDALCQAGVPVASMPGEGYRLVPGYHLPPIAFAAEEAVQILLGIDLALGLGTMAQRDAARSAAAKVDAVLLPETREAVARLRERIRASPQIAGELSPHLPLLQEAVVGDRVVRLRYHSYEPDRVTKRDVEAHLLVFYSGDWHLIGYCRLREDVRDFRAGRIESARLLDETFVRRKIDDGYDPGDMEIEVRILIDERTAEQLETSTITDELSAIVPLLADARQVIEARARVDALLETRRKSNIEVERLQNQINGKATTKQRIAILSEFENVLSIESDAAAWDALREIKTSNIEKMEDILNSSRTEAEQKIVTATEELREWKENCPYTNLARRSRDEIQKMQSEVIELPSAELNLQTIVGYESDVVRLTRALVTLDEQVTEATETGRPDVDFDAILKDHELLTSRIKKASDEAATRTNAITAIAETLNHVRMMAQQATDAIESHKQKSKDAQVYGREIRHLSLVESAFGRSGIQALLIEAAIKPFEAIASRLMREATDGQMDVRIETVREKTDGTMREELSIMIRDRSGERDVYRYSAGERRIISTIIRL